MCYVRIGTNKGSIFEEIPEINYNNVTMRDIFNIAHSIKGENIKVFGWIEVDKNNNIKED